MQRGKNEMVQSFDYIVETEISAVLWAHVARKKTLLTYFLQL